MSTFNIRSISELDTLVASTNSTTNLKSLSVSFNNIDSLTAAFGYEAVSDMLNHGYDTLSCPDGTYIEMSIQENGSRKSYKFDFSDFLNRLNKTLAAIVKLNAGGITKAQADEYYVPLSGNPTNPMTGTLYISVDAGETALSASGPSYFGFGTSMKIEVLETEIRVHSPTKIDNDLSASNLSASNYLCCNNLKCTTDASIGHNLTVNGTATIKDANISASADITKAHLMSKTTIDDGDFTTLSGTNLYAATLSSTNLKAASLSATNGAISNKLTVKDIENTNNISTTTSAFFGYANDSFALSVRPSNAGGYYVLAKELSASELRTPTFKANTIIAINELKAGIKSDSETEYYVHASNSSDMKGLSATNLSTPTFTAANIIATYTLKGGRIDAGNFQFEATTTVANARSSHITALTADGISELTAKAACWS